MCVVPKHSLDVVTHERGPERSSHFEGVDQGG